MDYNNYGNYNNSSSSSLTFFSLGYLILIILVLVAGWRMYEKAKRPGWAIIIPIYNIYVLLKIVGRPGWWVILYFIPLVNIIVHLIVSLNLAKSYGRSEAFGIFLLWLIPIVGYLMLGFGGSKYKGPSVK